MAKVKTHKIVSTLSAPVGFTVYETDAQGNKSPVRKVLIGGGANVWDGVIVPSGYGTLVSDEELAILRENSVFCAFEKEGGIVVASLKDNQDKVIENMTEKDAHYYIEKQAMDTRLSKREVAEHIIRTYDT